MTSQTLERIASYLDKSKNPRLYQWQHANYFNLIKMEERGMIRPLPLSTYYECSDCEELNPVEWIDGEAWCICHECGGHRVEDTEMLQSWEILFSVIMERVLTPLGLGPFIEVYPDKVWKVGIQGKTNIYFVRGLQNNDYPQMIRDYGMNKDVVLLTLSDWNQKHLSKHIVDCSIVSLEQVVHLTDEGEFSFDLKKWEQIMKRYAVIPTEVPLPDFAFYDKGNHFEIIFDGIKKTFKSSLGLKYILSLIKTPNKEVFVSDLKFVTDGMNPEKMEHIKGEGADGDERTLAEVGQKYRECQQEIAAAERDDNQTLLSELTEEMNGYIKYFNSIKEFNQPGCKEKNYRLDKIRLSVYRAIRRAFEDIEKQLPKCSQHLDHTIETGYFLIYKDPDIKWVF